MLRSAEHQSAQNRPSRFKPKEVNFSGQADSSLQPRQSQGQMFQDSTNLEGCYKV